MREVRFMEQALSSGWVSTLRALARWYRCKPKNLQRVRHLRYLDAPLQERLLRGEAEHLTLDELVAIADMPTPDQAAAFEALLKRAAKEDRKPTAVRMILDLCRRSMLVRRVVCFSPQELLNRRENLREELEALHTKVEQLNREQRERDRPRSEVQLLSAIRRILEEQHWLRAFEVSIKRRRGPGCSWHDLVLTREEEWRRRRCLARLKRPRRSPRLAPERRGAGEAVLRERHGREGLSAHQE